MYYILGLCTLCLLPLLQAKERATFNLENPDNQKYSIWRLLQSHSPPAVLSNVEMDDLQGDVSEPQLEFSERNLDYPNRRAILHKACKIIKQAAFEDDDEYEYSPKYENISCVETTQDPFKINPPHSEQYCFIFHHPHEYITCETRTRSVRLFRKQRQGSWEPYTRTIGVGCGCSLGVTFAG